MTAVTIHISKIKMDTPIHVIGTYFKNSITSLKSVFDLTVGFACYVPSGHGGVYSVKCESIEAGVITLVGNQEGDITHYKIDLHAPVMSDTEFTNLFNSLKTKSLDNKQRSALYLGEKQGYMNIQSYTQYGLSANGWARAKQLGL